MTAYSGSLQLKQLLAFLLYIPYKLQLGKASKQNRDIFDENFHEGHIFS